MNLKEKQYNNVKKDKKEAILNVLKANPDGLTIQEISKLTGMSRITTTIYVHELLGEGKITERKIGAYRLFYLKDKYLEVVKEKEILEKIKEKIK
ncbi:MAG: winged helix-turn-helix transcriptional regulator [Candidatus Aenigmatarchaeota archaeon]